MANHTYQRIEIRDRDAVYDEEDDARTRMLKEMAHLPNHILNQLGGVEMTQRQDGGSYRVELDSNVGFADRQVEETGTMRVEFGARGGDMGVQFERRAAEQALAARQIAEAQRSGDHEGLRKARVGFRAASEHLEYLQALHEIAKAHEAHERANPTREPTPEELQQMMDEALAARR